MARARITPGSVGPVSVVPLGTDLDGREQIVPAPLTDGGEPLPYPKGWKVGATVKVTTDAGVEEFVLTRWRGLARVVDAAPDDRGRFTQYQVRAWRSTRAAAEAGTRAAGELRLAEMAASHARSAAAAARGAQGDLDTTVGDLLERVPGLPEVTKLAPRTRDAYLYTVAHMRELDPDLMNALPREVDVARVRSYMRAFADEHGSSSTARAKALLRRTFDLATESAGMRTPFNPVSAARDVIPNRRVRDAGRLDKRRPISDEDVAGFLAALRSDPAAGPMLGPRNKSRHGAAGTGPANPVDVADLLTLTFATGLRVGEATALRWGDLHLAEGRGTASVTGTVAWIKGLGTVRQPRPKSQSSQRLVPLTDELVQLLVLRANVFGIDPADPAVADRPVFPSPQKHTAYRQPGNLMKAIRAMMDRHGLDWASSHTARRWRVTSLLDRGVPLGKVSDVVGHADIRVTLGYVQRGGGRATDDQVRAAL